MCHKLWPYHENPDICYLLMASLLPDIGLSGISTLVKFGLVLEFHYCKKSFYSESIMSYFQLETYIIVLSYIYI